MGRGQISDLKVELTELDGNQNRCRQPLIERVTAEADILGADFSFKMSVDTQVDMLIMHLDNEPTPPPCAKV